MPHPTSTCLVAHRSQPEWLCALRGLPFTASAAGSGLRPPPATDTRSGQPRWRAQRGRRTPCRGPLAPSCRLAPKHRRGGSGLPPRRSPRNILFSAPSPCSSSGTGRSSRCTTRTQPRSTSAGALDFDNRCELARKRVSNTPNSGRRRGEGQGMRAGAEHETYRRSRPRKNRSLRPNSHADEHASQRVGEADRAKIDVSSSPAIGWTEANVAGDGPVRGGKKRRKRPGPGRGAADQPTANGPTIGSYRRRWQASGPLATLGAVHPRNVVRVWQRATARA